MSVKRRGKGGREEEKEEEEGKKKKVQEVLWYNEPVGGFALPAAALSLLDICTRQPGVLGRFVRMFRCSGVQL